MLVLFIGSDSSSSSYFKDQHLRDRCPLYALSVTLAKSVLILCFVHVLQLVLRYFLPCAPVW